MASRAQPKRERFMAEWPREKVGNVDGVRIGGRWFSLPEPGELVRLANLSQVRADRVFVGDAELAWVWDWELPDSEAPRNVQNWTRRQRAWAKFFRSRGERYWFERLPRENRQLVMPADYAMHIYKHHVLEAKVYYHHLPPTAKRGRPGGINYAKRIPFDVQFNEELYRQHLAETEEAR